MVLCQNVRLAAAGVKKVAENEIDDLILASNGTAGFPLVMGLSLSPLPPARIMPMTLRDKFMLAKILGPLSWIS